MKEYTSKKPVFSESILIAEETDPAHADNINAAPKQLLQNILAMKNEKGQPGGVATLGKDGKVPIDQLPDAIFAAKTIYLIPTQNGTLTYNSSVQSPEWNEYDGEKLEIGGTYEATDAGTYEAAFKPKDGYKWWDGTVEGKTARWAIDKADGILALDKDSVSFSGADTAAVTVTRSGTGAVSAASAEDGIATAEVEGTKIIIRGVSNGSTTITVSVEEDDNYNAPESKAISVTYIMASETLAENSPDVIKMVIQSGQAPNLWSVGDKVPIKLKGTVGALTFSNQTYYAFILGFNHNPSIEGNNTVHFQFGKTADGTDIAFVDSENGKDGSTAAFRMNTANTSSGGWEGSYMRKTICPAFLAALPAEWRKIIADCTKYSDNTGGGGNAAGSVTATQDKIWLLSEYEIYGVQSYANSTEQRYQQQYDFYKNGNEKAKYHHNTGGGCSWWHRSAFKTTDTAYVYTTTTGSKAYKNASFSLGFAPGFMAA